MDDVRAVLESGRDPQQKLDALAAICYAPAPEPVKAKPKAEKPAPVEQPEH